MISSQPLPLVGQNEISMTGPDFSEQDIRNGVIEFSNLCSSGFGPLGGNTMVISDEEVIVSKDLHRLIDYLDITNPGARVVANGAVEQKERIGDGSLALVLLVGSLLNRATNLLEQGHKRPTIEQGFHQAGQVAISVLPKYTYETDNRVDDPALNGVIRTACPRRLATNDTFVSAIKEAASLVTQEQSNHNQSGLDNLIFEVNPEQGAPPVELIHGVLLKRKPVERGMSEKITNPRIAVIGGGKKAGTGIENHDLRQSGGRSGKGRTEVTFKPDTPDQIENFKQGETEEIIRQVTALDEVGVDAVFCTMGINDEAKLELNRAGITAFRRLTSGMAKNLTRATGGQIVMEVDLVESEMVGSAGALRAFEADGEDYVRIEGCDDGSVGTLLFSNAVEEISQEVERDVRTAIVAAIDILGGAQVVPGGGGIETRIAMDIERNARGIDDGQAIAMDAYADALLDIPRTLIRSTGQSPLDIIPQLRSAEKKNGYDCYAGEIIDTYPNGPLNLENVVHSTIQSATEIACQLVRIDEVLPAKDEGESSGEEIDTTPDMERDFKWRRS